MGERADGLFNLALFAQEQYNRAEKWKILISDLFEGRICWEFAKEKYEQMKEQEKKQSSNEEKIK
jgi:hypothetical protein